MTLNQFIHKLIVIKMGIVNNFHTSFFNKIKDPIFIDNKKTLDKGKNTHKVVYTIIDKLAMLF
ncbi:hypothetical protein AM232_12370 [Bacillus sp. FJAT-21352]|nr:hypothetical protein AM232_12370 [Bacillus sp. FJAT-21352]